MSTRISKVSREQIAEADDKDEPERTEALENLLNQTIKTGDSRNTEEILTALGPNRSLTKTELEELLFEHLKRIVDREALSFTAIFATKKVQDGAMKQIRSRVHAEYTDPRLQAIAKRIAVEFQI